MASLRQFDVDYEKRFRRYRLNDRFFDQEQESESQFYWAGFLASNATICTNVGVKRAYRIQLNLGFEDAEHLKKLTKALESDIPIKEVRYGGIHQVRIVISSKYLVEELRRFGVGSHKRTYFTIPDWVLKHRFSRHFLRGWVDGNGNFYDEEFRTSGPVQVIEQIKHHFETELELINPEMNITLTANNTAKIRYCNHQDIKTIANYLYRDSQDYLDRKKIAAFSKM